MADAGHMARKGAHHPGPKGTCELCAPKAPKAQQLARQTQHKGASRAITGAQADALNALRDSREIPEHPSPSAKAMLDRIDLVIVAGKGEAWELPTLTAWLEALPERGRFKLAAIAGQPCPDCKTGTVEYLNGDGSDGELGCMACHTYLGNAAAARRRR